MQPKDWSIKMNKKERRLALATALQSAANDIIVIESLVGKVEDKKTKSLLEILNKVRASTDAQHTASWCFRLRASECSSGLATQFAMGCSGVDPFRTHMFRCGM